MLVILLTAFASVETAVEAMKLGAFHFANKPFNLDDVAAIVARALETTRLRREVRQLRANEARPYSLAPSSASRRRWRQLRQLVAKVAASPASTVLLTGESGTGKDLVAKVIHYSSARAGRPFMNITCSALPEQLLESELFGHERGAFTDARQQKRGLLESADGGTVFLDEIGEMAPALQAKLLRVLEEKSFKRVGGAGDIRVDVRVVAATNRDLEEQVEGRVPQRPVLPAERAADRAAAAARARRGRARAGELLRRHVQPEFKKRSRASARRRWRCCKGYGWPGNVRELRNVVERAMLLAEGDRLEAGGLRRADERGLAAATRSSCRPAASTSRTSSAASSCRRSARRAATRRRRRRCSA